VVTLQKDLKLNFKQSWNENNVKSGTKCATRARFILNIYQQTSTHTLTHTVTDECECVDVKRYKVTWSPRQILLKIHLNGYVF